MTGQNDASGRFVFSFLIIHKFYTKICSFQQDLNSDLRIEGEHIDHLTTTAVQMMQLIVG